MLESAGSFTSTLCEVAMLALLRSALVSAVLALVAFTEMRPHYLEDLFAASLRHFDSPVVSVSIHAPIGERLFEERLIGESRRPRQ